MGNLSLYSTSTNNELKNVFDDSNNPLTKENTSNDKTKQKHRNSFNENRDRELRNQYFHKLNEKQVVERHSLREKSTIDREINDINDIRHTLGGNDRFFSDENETMFDDFDKMDLEKPFSIRNEKSRSKEKNDKYFKKSQSSENIKNPITIQNSLMLNIEDDIETNFDTNTTPIDIINKRSFGRRKNNLSDGVINETIKIDNQSINSDFKKNNKPNQSEYELTFLKNGEDLRRSYIAKLIYKNVWQPSKEEKHHNTLMIFDWDDTLLCTSFLTPNGVFNEEIELGDKEMEKIAKLEFAVLRILTIALEKGDTYIITNAAPGWVEYSAERFYPSVKKLLDKVTIVSARGEFESLYPGDSRMWKIQAFLKMQKIFDSNLVTNLICLGDSFIEMEAAHILASKFSQAFIKTVKFRESPKPEELYKQLHLVADQFPAIFSGVKNLTIRVEKKIKK